MALLFFDGFDTYQAVNGPGQLTSMGGYDSVGSYTAVATGGWTGNMLSVWGSNPGSVHKNLGAPSSATFGFGAMVYINPGYNINFAYFQDSTAATQIILAITASGALSIARSGTVILTSANGVIPAAGWYHIEIKVFLDDSAGTAEIRVDEVSVASVSGIDTKYTGLANIQYYTLYPQVSIKFDDTFIWDDTGSVNNDWLGYNRVYTMLPTANGATQDWTPNTGNAWDAINETGAPDEDTTYVGSSTVGDVSLFTLDNVPGTAVDVKGLQTRMYAAKSDAGACGVKHGLLSGSSNHMGAEHALGTSYGVSFDIHETDPDTSALWTVAAANAAQLRLERTS